MKASRLPRPTGPARPLPVFSPSELARKRLRHLSGSSSGSSSSIIGAPTKTSRLDSPPPSLPPVFYSDVGKQAPSTSRGAPRSAGVPAPPKAKPTDLAKLKNRTEASLVASTPLPTVKAKAPHTGGKAAGKSFLPNGEPSAPEHPPLPSATAPGSASPLAPVPAPAPQRPPRGRGKAKDSPVGADSGARNRASSPVPSTSSAAFTAHQQDPVNPPADDDEGFTLVTKTKKGKKGQKSGAASNLSENLHLPDQRPTPAPRISLASRDNPTPRPIPAPRTIRPSVGVARPQPPPSDFPAFRVPAQEGFGTSYDAVAALEEKFPFLSMRNIIGKDGSSVLVPLNKATYDTLEVSASDPGITVQLMKIDPRTQLTKGVVMGYPLRMPLSLLQRHSQVEEATRCVSSRQQENTKQVLITVRGPLPPQIDLGNWGIFYTRPYTPEPLRCFKCQRFGHHQANCSRPAVCGICSARHPTQQCLEKYKVKAAVTHKCANCGQGHHAWNPNCPARLQRVNSGRERQVEWVQEQQRNALVPAPPGTFVWGQQRQGNSETPHSVIHQEDFPPLQEPTRVVPSRVTQSPP